MRYSMKRQEQLLLEYLRHQRTGGPGGQGAENRGPEERNGDNREGGDGQHVLEGKTGSLESGQGGEIETRGGELKVNGLEDGLRGKAQS